MRKHAEPTAIARASKLFEQELFEERWPAVILAVTRSGDSSAELPRRGRGRAETLDRVINERNILAEHRSAFTQADGRG
jgi:hypothetical protein